MRYHLFGLANIPTCKENTYEPFTPLVWNMAKMLKDNDHEVIFYGAAGSDAPCDEMVTLVPAALMAEGLKMGPHGVPAAAWHNDGNAPTWQSYIANGRKALRNRYRTGDIALISFGRYQQFVAEEAELHCEFICGYSGIFSRHKVFPSRAWMHYLYGELKMENSPNWSDAVIPHYLDIDDFPFQDKKNNYLLCLGRLNHNKGTDIAIDIANRSGMKIVVAGVDMMTHDVPECYRKLPGNVEFTGYVNPAKRLELLRNARALLHPCRYIEPFGMVVIEALACGTPVIASDWGGLPEIIESGVTGFCCRSMEEFVVAAKNVHYLDPQDCRDAAARNHSLPVAYELYREYFRRLSQLLGGGWYETRGTWRGPEIVERIAKLPRDKEDKLYGAEIGVDRGSLSSYLLREVPDLHLVMVDTWQVFPTDSSYAQSGDTVVQRTQEQRDSDLARAVLVTENAPDRRRILRRTSAEAAELIPDGFLDFVFIDADHSYEGVSADIRLWAPKVKAGGLLCGHDYEHPSFPTWGVKQAVDEYAAKVGQPVQVGADWTWFITN